MAKKSNSIFESKGWKVGMKYLYGIGASVVIVGALFKILHLPFASEMLIVGLGTEAVIFFFSAFEPLPPEEKHYDWEKVYPQLADDSDDIDPVVAGLQYGGGGGGNLPSFNTDAIDAANKAFSPELFDSLTTSVRGLKNSVDGLADITDASVATSDYASKVKQATDNLSSLNTSFGTTVTALSSFSNSAEDVKAYQTQIKSVTTNLQSLNAVYELELQDAQKHLSSINGFYDRISSVMQNLVDTSKDTEELRGEVGKLTKNMSSLNAVYGGMLSAMASGAKA